MKDQHLTLDASAFLTLIRGGEVIFDEPAGRVKVILNDIGFEVMEQLLARARNRTMTSDQIMQACASIDGNGLVNDPTNNGGNAFLGNTIVVRQGMRRTVTYWYDWSADPQAVRKLSIWGNAIGNTDPLTIVYDPRTMLVKSVTSPRIPPGSPFENVVTKTVIVVAKIPVVTRLIPLVSGKAKTYAER